MDGAFTTLVRNIDRVDEEWSRKKSGRSATASVVGLWKEGQKLHSFLREERHGYEEQFAKIASRFSNSYKQQQRREYEQKVNDAFNTVKSAYKADIDTYVDDKIARLDSMLVTPPSQNQRDLLEALKLRGKNLSLSEATRILPVFYDNYVALEGFRGICKDAGFNLYTPGENAMDLYPILEEFRAHMYRIADQMGADKSADMFVRSFFWTSDDPNYVEPTVEKFSQAFDTVPQLQNHSMDILTAGEQARISTLFRGIESLDPDKATDMIQIVRKTEQIVADHPDDLQTIMKSPYGKYVDLCFNLRKAKLDAVAVRTLTGEADGKKETANI